MSWFAEKLIQIIGRNVWGFKCYGVIISGWVFVFVHRVWVLQTLSGVGPPWRHRRENGERTENKTTTMQYMYVFPMCVIEYVDHHSAFTTTNANRPFSRAFISSSYIREESPILSLSWWGWRSCYESVVLGAPFTPAASTAEAERRVAHSISFDITLWRHMRQV